MKQLQADCYSNKEDNVKYLLVSRYSQIKRFVRLHQPYQIDGSVSFLCLLQRPQSIFHRDTGDRHSQRLHNPSYASFVFSDPQI